MQTTQIGTPCLQAQIARDFNRPDEFLAMHGIKPTRQRVAIAKILFAKEQHLSADAVMARVHEDKSAVYVSKATVYNTLNLFVKNGILKEVSIDPQKVIFDTNTDHHHHVFNLDNGEIRDIHPVDIDLTKIEGIQPGQDVSRIELVIKIQNPAEKNVIPLRSQQG